MEINLLDVGTTKYGDCILITHGKYSILIDGAHSKDKELIKSQLQQLLNTDQPINVDLLVVTHCHSDHIGCLPALVNDGDLTAITALLADEKLGFGKDKDGNEPSDAPVLSGTQKKLVAALQEEDQSDLPTDELRQFIEDAATLESQYLGMINILSNSGTTIYRHGKMKTAEVKKVENLFKKGGLLIKILGPSLEQLAICANVIGNTGKAVSDFIDNIKSDNDVIDIYRELMKRNVDDIGLEDRPGTGAAKNNQSTVLKVTADGWSALLAGDMQFAEPEVSGLDEIMATLFTDATKAGPYDFIKLTHHTSYNGINEDVLKEYLKTKARQFAHSGGLNDPSHPDAGRLPLLEGIHEDHDKLDFARTDHNGLITVSKKGKKVQMSVSKGELNDFHPNKRQDEEVPITTLPAATAANKPLPIATSVTTVKTEGESFIEVFAKIPHTTTKVTLTIEVEPAFEKKKIIEAPASNVNDMAQASAKINFSRLSGLAIVTCTERLKKNIGTDAVNDLVTAIGNNSSLVLVDFDAKYVTAPVAAQYVQQQVQQSRIKGVVLLGGYDVVPSNQIDVVGATLRQAINNSSNRNKDADDFIIWSDDIYGGIDLNGLGILPVSRVPDGKNASFMFNVLGATPVAKLANKFGVRNIARPFAEISYSQIPGSSERINKSETFGPSHMPKNSFDSYYFMLHGSAYDTSTFWGEDQSGDCIPAVSINNLPQATNGSVAFAGCCWGALTVNIKASRWLQGNDFSTKTVSDSLAMAFLNAGEALAFIGCTGSHYSPNEAPYNFYGKPMHDHFWTAIGKGKKPAESLHLAKQQYAAEMPHGLQGNYNKAIELKILKQFTCLGLGW